MSDKALFITFEGIDGSSKSLQAKLLFEWMNKRGMECKLTREPGNPYIKECNSIRELLLDPSNAITNRAELYCFKLIERYMLKDLLFQIWKKAYM